MTHANPTVSPHDFLWPLQHLPLLFLASLLCACSGGSGTGSDVTPPLPPPAFALASVVPANAASGVARDTPITASFNGALDPTSVNTGNITLLGPGNNRIPIALAVTGGGTVEVRPVAGALPGDTSYTLTLAAAIKDSKGQTLTQATSRSFSTSSPSWLATADDLAALPTHTGGTFPTVCADAAGGTTVAWLAQFGSLSSTLYAARLDPITGQWGAPVTLAATEGAGAIMAIKLVPGPAGDVFLTWTRDDFGGTRKNQFARYSAIGASWSVPADVKTEPATGFSPGIATPISDAAGNLTLLSSSAYSLHATRLDVRTNTWSEPRAIEHPHPNNYIFHTRSVVDVQGNIVAAWIQVDDEGRAIYSARYDVAAAQWAAAKRVASTPITGSDGFAMGVDGAGVVTLAWTRSAGIAGGDTIWASRLDPQGQAWSPGVRVDRTDPGAPDARGVMLAVDSAGNATAIWGQNGMRTARWAPGAAEWSTPALIAPLGIALEGEATVLLADVAGNLTLLSRQNQKHMASRYLATTAQWQVPVMISTPAAGSGIFTNAPVASMDGAGNVLALWFAWNQLPLTDRYVLSFNRLR